MSELFWSDESELIDKIRMLEKDLAAKQTRIEELEKESKNYLDQAIKNRNLWADVDAKLSASEERVRELEGMLAVFQETESKLRKQMMGD